VKLLTCIPYPFALKRKLYLGLNDHPGCHAKTAHQTYVESGTCFTAGKVATANVGKVKTCFQTNASLLGLYAKNTKSEEGERKNKPFHHVNFIFGLITYTYFPS
jgi:hypothetical protein